MEDSKVLDIENCQKEPGTVESQEISQDQWGWRKAAVAAGAQEDCQVWAEEDLEVVSQEGKPEATRGTGAQGRGSVV